MQRPLIFIEEDILRAVAVLRGSTDLIDRILFVQICTGARLVEVLKVSEFHPHIPPNRSQPAMHVVHVEGLAKTRGGSSRQQGQRLRITEPGGKRWNGIRRPGLDRPELETGSSQNRQQRRPKHWTQSRTHP